MRAQRKREREKTPNRIWGRTEDDEQRYGGGRKACNKLSTVAKQIGISIFQIIKQHVHTISYGKWMQTHRERLCAPINEGNEQQTRSEWVESRYFKIDRSVRRRDGREIERQTKRMRKKYTEHTHTHTPTLQTEQSDLRKCNATRISNLCFRI